MNEDEAFIRAIVDGPGDDLPRLVYADWLDDRSDPHGPYLRAEREAVEMGDIERLRKLAVGLDPVWVARVSRPPVGVCCDGLMFLDAATALTSTDIDEAERLIGIEITGAYRAFLLNYNGGRPKLRQSLATDEVDAGHYRNRFPSVLLASRRDEEFSLVRIANEFRAIVPDLVSVELWGAEQGDVPWQGDAIPIDKGDSYFQLFYAVRGPYEGRLHVHDWTGDWCRFGCYTGSHGPPTLAEFLHRLPMGGCGLVDTYPTEPLQDFWKP